MGNAAEEQVTYVGTGTQEKQTNKNKGHVKNKAQPTTLNLLIPRDFHFPCNHPTAGPVYVSDGHQYSSL